ncbi:MAG TPA: FKBP-type peptidyl-prolyl cis-trans isomerase [Patescibacteria group bacterium]|jgi:FKBP-type peptidyl-prolyl cis-trans isomerase|nr:FKBP-type peptidyl-prolyl cis-trans isomerase [Patescibacteria group bacterium]
MARKRDRIFALTMALTFFITALGFSFFVIWQMISSSNSSSSTSSNSSTSKTSKSSTTPKLAGTEMTDFTPVASVPSLKITDTKIGTGAVVKAGQTVTVTYTGAVASTGIIFQSSQDSSPPYATLNLSDVIKGWQEGIPGMKVGGTRQLLIPANLAYGANPPAGSGIPANAGLVFTILLLKIGS